MKIVVTGASGLLGHHFLEFLILQPVQIIATYRTTEPTFLHQNITWVACDLLDMDAVLDVLVGADHVYHCANEVSFSGRLAQLMHNNVSTTANIVNACLTLHVKKLLFISSVAAIARGLQGDLITEKTPWVITPEISSYGLSKYYAEMEVWRGHAEGLNVIVVNPSVILAKADWHQSSAQLFKHAFNEFPFYTSGTNGFVDVHDVVSASYLLMQSDIVNERYILNGENISYKQLFTMMAKGFDKAAPSKLAPRWLSNLMVPFYAILSLFKRKPALITKETVHTAYATYTYSNQKLLTALPEFIFTPIAQTITRLTKQYLP
jgi:dihydroflavonol-4-reductase